MARVSGGPFLDLRAAQTGHPSTRRAQKILRYHYMDSMRAAMMVAGVFFHAGMVYRPDLPWRFKDPADTAFFSWLTDFLHTFRMPAFFAVAGFFCALSFAREPGVRKLYSRLLVFGVPFLAMMFTLQPLQYALKLDIQGSFQGFGAPFWRDYFHGGEYISHLWFLINLVFYYLAAWTIVQCYRGRDYAAIPWVARIFQYKSAMAVLACAAFATVDLLIRDGSLGAGYDVELVFQYAPFFVAGYIMFRHSHLFAQFRRVTLADVLLMLALALYDPSSGGRIGQVVGLLAFYQFGFVLTGICMLLFHKFLDRENGATRVVADSAYTIYLFHQFLIVVVATWVARQLAGAGVFLKYSIVVGVVLLITISVHQLLIARLPVLRFLFTGRTSERAGVKTIDRAGQRETLDLLIAVRLGLAPDAEALLEERRQPQNPSAREATTELTSERAGVLAAVDHQVLAGDEAGVRGT